MIPDNLPVDIKQEILKYNPYYYRLNKDIYNKNLYYNNHCHLPISKQELFNYINDVVPRSFYIFTEDSTGILTIHEFDIYDGINYVYDITQLYKADVYNGSIIKLNTKSNFFSINTLQITIDFIINLYKNTNIVYFDIYTTYNILSRRQSCIGINPNYNKEITLNFIKSMLTKVNIVDLNSYFEWTKQIMYLYYHSIIDIDFNDPTDVFSINKFNIYGQPFNKNKLEKYIKSFGDLDSELNINYLTKKYIK